MAGAPGLRGLRVGCTRLLEITKTVPAPKDDRIQGTRLSVAGFGAVLLQICMQITDKPGTSVQPSWLAEDVKSPLSLSG